MIAIPITPGHSYRVRGFGLDLKVLAAHPCDALLILLGIAEGRDA